MSTPADATKTSLVPESPTTARPLEMDDDDIQDTGVVSTSDATTTTRANAAPAAAAATSPSSTEVPPPKPPRPLTEAQINQQMLQEAFPSIEPSVVKAVLTASRGQIEPAFNALLEMTDPDAAARDSQPPPQPPRPVAAPVGPTSTDRAQLEADELYARQLAEHYENVGAYEARTANNRGPTSGYPRGRQATGLQPNRGSDERDREHSFLDDDLPVIKESVRNAFVETQSKVSTWFTTLKKKVDEQLDEMDRGHGSQGAGAGAGASGNNSFMGRPSRDQTRRSADYDRYDADPELLSDDFAGMKFNSDGTPVRGYQGAPSGGNPNLFKPPPPSKSPKPSDGRRVAFRDTVEDIDAYNASPKLPPKDSPPATAPGSGAKASKWQPLSAVEPSPIAENDPFSLGDSDDERDDKGQLQSKPVGTTPAAGASTDDEATARLKAATAEAMAGSLTDKK